MSTPIRIKDNVYSRLEINAKGYESVSDTIHRAVHALEVLEAFDMMHRQVASSIEVLDNEGIEKEKTLLVHYDDNAKNQAIEMINNIDFGHDVTLESGVNYIKLNVSRSDR
ncbi:hypothetical protein [Vibrio cincinnatiensis]|uniref:hypothetical protein n=1 Tax=Vibrio cincinnatiensis TaxID=675 RepID=UPI001EE0BD41|nr:hypothetical protein [Vibrio cincinnatiensis]MCG3740669.1 hypothetical protein [Vibrio cincinnatiensis]